MEKVRKLPFSSTLLCTQPHFPTSGLNVLGQKRPAMREPKMSLMAASLGGGTWKMANWRLRRLGMSLRPAPGVTMAATNLRGGGREGRC